jgi:hypothetical protein
MTKLFDRTFGPSAEDAAADVEISEKIGLLQQFVKPQHLDIPKVLRNEASWLVSHSFHSNYNVVHIFISQVVNLESCNFCVWVAYYVGQNKPQYEV